MLDYTVNQNKQESDWTGLTVSEPQVFFSHGRIYYDQTLWSTKD